MLPNVSAIYRDLAFMADPKSQQRPSEYSYSQSAQSLYQQKQSRHNQLMEKLRNAQRESSNLTQQLRGIDAENHSNQLRGPYVPYEQSQQRYDYSQNTNFAMQDRSFGSGRGWKPPNIRYRHIQDKKQPEVFQIKADPIIEIRANEKLQREFYQNQQRENAEQRRSVRVEAAIGNERRKQEENMKIEEASQSSYGRTWANRQSKFEDKLESYYQLCKKRPVSRKMQSKEPEQVNKARFTRTSNNRPTVVQLEKAIKLLTLD